MPRLFQALLRLATTDVRPLRHRDYRLLFVGQLASFLGTQVTAVAVPFQLYQVTHSSLAVGAMGLVELVPVLGLAFLGGALADASDRRLMVLATEVVFTITSALLLVNAVLPAPLLWAVYALAAIQAALFGLQRPSLDALLPRLVPADEIVAAGALNGLRATVGLLAGPALAGVLIALFGLPVAYAADVFSFVVSLVAFVILFVAVSVLYGALAGLGVFDSLQRVVSDVTSSQGSPGVNAKTWFNASRILGYTALLGSLNIVLITAMSTIGAVVYNLTSRLVGGVEVTLKETE